MIEIGPAAVGYFNRLIVQQGIAGLGIRLEVTEPGTARADCRLEFCEPEDVASDDWVIEAEGFNVYVSSVSAPWLQAANIEFEETATGGQLTIKAPRIKGDQPGADASILERVQFVLESEINPAIASHGGQVSLVELSAEGDAILRFGGGCQGCKQVDVTLKHGVEKTLMERIPELRAVRDVTDHASGSNPYFR